MLFKDVAGLAEAKVVIISHDTNPSPNPDPTLTREQVEVMEVVDFLKHPEKYKSLGAKIATP